MNFVSRIPVERLNEMIKLVKKLSKKFKVDISFERGPVIVYNLYDPNIDKNVDVYGYDVTFIIDDAAYAKFEETGATFMGVISIDDVVTVSRSKSNDSFDISSLKDEIENLICSGCNKRNTSRRKLFVFELADGSIKTFGTSCAKRYFGVNFQQVIDKINKIKSYIEGEGNRFNDQRIIHFDKWIAIVDGIIRKYGYVSRKASMMDETKECTTQFAFEMYNLFEHGPNKNIECQVKMFAEVTEMVEKFQGCTEDFFEMSTENDDDDFSFNLTNSLGLAKNGYVNGHTMPYLTYLYFMFIKDSLEKKVTWNMDHNYRKGDKIKNLTVKVVKSHYFNSRFGDGFWHTLSDPNNVKLKWCTGQEFEIGSELIISIGTVKNLEDHEEYGKAVVITRCRVAVVDKTA